MPKQWDIVLTPFPFTDLTGNKVRPVVIISNKLKGDDVIVLFISSVKKNITNFDIKVKSSQENGLKADSVIKCSKIATLEKKIILGELGTLEKEKQKEISIRIKNLFDL